MEKRREIPGKPKPMGAAIGDVLAVKARLDRLGIDFHEAVERSGYSRPQGYRLLKGEASVKMLRDLDEWTRKNEMAKKIATPQETETQLDEWSELGRELMKLDGEEFAHTLDGLRGLLEATKMRASAIRKMFRATPEPEK
jgi:hypothetical protein